MRVKSGLPRLTMAFWLAAFGAAAQPHREAHQDHRAVPGGGCSSTLTRRNRAVVDARDRAREPAWTLRESRGCERRPRPAGVCDCRAGRVPGGCSITAEALAVAPHFDPKLNQRYKALTPVTYFVSAPGVVYADPSFKVSNLREVVAYAKAEPDRQPELLVVGPGNLAASCFSNG